MTSCSSRCARRSAARRALGAGPRGRGGCGSRLPGGERSGGRRRCCGGSWRRWWCVLPFRPTLNRRNPPVRKTNTNRRHPPVMTAPTHDKPLRKDAHRNREKLLAAAVELFRRARHRGLARGGRQARRRRHRHALPPLPDARRARRGGLPQRGRPAARGRRRAARRACRPTRRSRPACGASSTYAHREARDARRAACRSPAAAPTCSPRRAAQVTEAVAVLLGGAGARRRARCGSDVEAEDVLRAMGAICMVADGDDFTEQAMRDPAPRARRAPATAPERRRGSRAAVRRLMRTCVRVA